MSIKVPLIIAATTTGAVTALRTSISLPSTIAVVPTTAVEVTITATATGALTGTVLLEQSVDNSNWTTNSTAAIVGTNFASLQFVAKVTAPYLRANLSAVSGTSTAVTVVAEILV